MEKTSQNSTAFLTEGEEIQGFAQNPAALFQAEMEKICANMQDLPFYQNHIPCFCPPFVLLEKQWIGAVLTPWMLSIVVLPGPDQIWLKKPLGDKLNVALPYKTFTFTVSGIDPVPQYLSCSLQSPLDPHLSAEQAIQLTKDCLQMAISLPVKQQQPDLNRRHIFQAMVK